MQAVRRTCAALLLGAAAAASVSAQSTTILSPDEARLTAAQYLSAGRAAASAEITNVLIKRDRTDAASLIIHAHSMRTLGRHDAAQAAARDGWRVADTDMERFGAAMAMAMALSSDGHKTRAQIWLRRAGQVAPNAQMKARAARDYRYLRKINPWSVNFSFGITPSDNVNNAPRDNTVVLGG